MKRGGGGYGGGFSGGGDPPREYGATQSTRAQSTSSGDHRISTHSSLNSEPSEAQPEDPFEATRRRIEKLKASGDMPKSPPRDLLPSQVLYPRLPKQGPILVNP